MPAQQPKQGLQYELLVAAALKTEVRKGEGRSLDLTSYEFNVNPISFKGDLTGIGFDVSLDITAVHDRLTFLIECKSSNTPGKVLSPRSEDFLKTVLEFMAAQNFSEKSGWQYRYLLVTDFDIGIEIRELMKNQTSDRLSRLTEHLKDFGNRKYGEKFNAGLVSPQLLHRTLGITSMDDRLTDEYLKERLNSNELFRNYYEDFSSRIRDAPSPLLDQSGIVVSYGYRWVRFVCSSDSHEGCEEVSIGGILCHLGNVKTLLDEITKIYERAHFPVCWTISSADFTQIPYVVKSSNSVDSKDTAGVLSEALTSLVSKQNPRVTLLIVPGTLDIVVADRARLASLVRSSFDGTTNKYDLRHLTEMCALGEVVKVSLGRKVLLEEYRIATRSEHFIAEEGIGSVGREATPLL